MRVGELPSVNRVSVDQRWYLLGGVAKVVAKDVGRVLAVVWGRGGRARRRARRTGGPCLRPARWKSRRRGRTRCRRARCWNAPSPCAAGCARLRASWWPDRSSRNTRIGRRSWGLVGIRGGPPARHVPLCPRGVHLEDGGSEFSKELAHAGTGKDRCKLQNEQILEHCAVRRVQIGAGAGRKCDSGTRCRRARRFLCRCGGFQL